MGIDEMMEEVRAGLARLEPAAAHAAAQEPGAFLVDTRPEYQRRAGGELPDAIVIERNHLEWRLDPASPGHIPEATSTAIRWIVLCNEGYASTLAADSLRRLGLTVSTDVIGGFQAWVAAGLPTDKPASPRPPRGPGSADPETSYSNSVTRP
ncbi:rhodanese-related sulfurtransferase [Kribbella antiqua]|uniref:Rhodanese-related sulfurtransferase n=1 Tax=Kribbella antiqua TaxID=2512217 RepID=A0A4R2J0K9_9ACTN|nr:rhodanese-like domain-containing protein [Kribbella antiqua]TCO51267.1 rhodanese-related sulfurtransferase [Kribbella antiqua]